MYAGPIIDAHHHLWNLSLGRHPWLTDPAQALPGLSDTAHMSRDYLPADLVRDAAGRNLVGSVHVEAAWDRSRDPVEETAWLDSLARLPGIAARYVAYAGLADAGAAEMLERQAANPRVVGVRETIRWHPDPARRWTGLGIADGAAFRAGAALLGRHGLLLELLTNPWHAEEIARLADDLPNQPILLNHCFGPGDRSPEALARWRAGLALLARRDNIAIKVSNFGASSPDRTLPVLRETVMTCIDAFGTRRSLFGTDYPVARRSMTYAAMVDAFAEIVAPFSEAEQRDLFHDNAARYYRF